MAVHKFFRVFTKTKVVHHSLTIQCFRFPRSSKRRRHIEKMIFDKPLKVIQAQYATWIIFLSSLVYSNAVLIIGGILAAWGQFRLWEIGIYAIIMGVLMIILEYPRGKRQKGTSSERKFQYPLTVCVSKGRLLTRSYFVRFVVYLVISVPCCFILPTVLGAMCYMMTSFIYLTAGIKGEEWVPIARKLEEQGPAIIEAPRRPPPRPPLRGVTLEDGNRI